MKKKSNLPKYEKPEVITYTSEDIMEVIGPVQAATGFLDVMGKGVE